MPYKDIEKRRECSRNNYYKHREKYLEVGKAYRNIPEIKEKRRLNAKKHYKLNREDILAKRKEREIHSPRRLLNYNLNPEDYLVILEQQNRKCAICEVDSTSLIKNVKFPLVVDHDHETNETRGLLCNNCNLVLGFSKENIEVLKNSISYIKKWKKKKK